jgi:hypothetical protein
MKLLLSAALVLSVSAGGAYAQGGILVALNREESL